MSLETLIFQDELEQIRETYQELLNKVTEFQEFINSPKAFDDDAEFEKKLSAVQKNVLMMAELTTPIEPVELIRRMAMAQPTQPQPEAKQLPLEQPTTESSFTLPKALVALASIVATAIVVERTLLPPIALVGVIAASLALAFAPQLKQLIQSFLEKKRKAEEEELKLEDVEKISGMFSWIRQQYVSAYFLIHFQGRPEEPIPETFEGLGFRKFLVNRGEYLRRTLPHTFMDIIMKVVHACEASASQRRNFIISAMVQASMSMAVQR